MLQTRQHQPHPSQTSQTPKSKASHRKPSECSSPMGKGISSRRSNASGFGGGAANEYNYLLRQLQERENEILMLKTKQMMATNENAQLQDYMNQIERLKKQLADSEQSREHLQKQLLEANKDMGKGNQSKFQDLLVAENKEYQEQVYKKDVE